MGKVAKIARRTFLVGSAAVVGGVLFGIYKVKKPYPNPLLKDLAEGETALTPYVQIDGKGITLMTPRTDMGQGAYSMQAALIAEELDVDLDQINVDPGMPAPAYYNRALGAESAPFKATDQSRKAETARGFFDAMTKLLGMEMTGGSSSVADGFVKLRLAGAVARETLKIVASQKTGVAVADLTTKSGHVILPDGKLLSYIELAPLVADIEPENNVVLRDPATWRLIGKPMQRIDVADKSTGQLTYGIDLSFENMIHATYKLNPGQGGGLKSFNAEPARKINGVIDVVEVAGGIAVLAKNTWSAFQGMDAVICNWEEAPYPQEMQGHWDILTKSFDRQYKDSRFLDDGDVDQAFEQEGQQKLTATFRTPYLAHAPLEPLCALVRYTPERTDVWACSQAPGFARNNVAKALGIHKDNVFFHAQMVGGSFGHRLEDEHIKRTAQIAKKFPGQTIKLTLKREVDFAHDFPRQIAMAKARGTTKDGKIQTFDLGIAMPSVMRSQMGRQGMSVPGPDTQVIAGAWDQPFNIPNYRVTGYAAQGLAPVSSWRSVGASTNAFFHESFFDQLCAQAKIDPLEERLRLCSHAPSREVLEKIKSVSSWSGTQRSKNRGRGLAFCLSFGVPCAQVIDVTSTPKGITIDKVYVVAQVGTVVDPINFENLVQGGVVWGLAHAMNCEITYAKGKAEQSNFHMYQGMRFYQCPDIEVFGLEDGNDIRGIGEPPVPPAAPALANAIFAATGKRLSEMPFHKTIQFV